MAELGRIVGDEQGRVVKTLGDGLMALFESPRQAVAAAEEMHDALHQMSPVGLAARTGPQAEGGRRPRRGGRAGGGELVPATR